MINRHDVENILLRIGVPAGNRGFKYIVDAVLLIDERGSAGLTKELYPAIALMNNTTSSGAERAIRHGFNVARNKGEYDEVEKYIGFTNRCNGSSLKTLYVKLKQESEQGTFSDRTPALTEDRVRQIVREELREIMGGIS